MFTEARMSRSLCLPHFGQIHSRSLSFNSLLTYPHIHVLELASKRPIRIRLRPYHSHLYSSCRKNSLHETDDMDFARRWFFNIPFTFKSSMIIVWFSRTIFDVTWCRKLLRWLETFSYCLARIFLARSLRLEPFFVFENLLCNTFSLASDFSRYLGLAYTSPFEQTAKSFIPTSIPIDVSYLTAGFPGLNRMK